MRFLIAGFLSLSLSTVAFAQARGQVESVGFGGAYRPGSWTPMVVQLVPTTGGSFNGRLEVVQEDLDRDTVIFTRQINLTGNNPAGSAPDQRFWMYFLPQPSRGDREILDGARSTDELTRIIKVRLVSEGGKELYRFPITQPLKPVESLTGGMSMGNRGSRLVITVGQNSQPNFAEYDGMIGLNEDVYVERVRIIAAGLPDSVIGYDAVDAIVWSDANPEELSAEQLTALEEFVKRGGHLVLLQDTTANQWQRVGARFALLTPVKVGGVEDRDDKLDTLRQLARVNNFTAVEWNKLKGPFRYAVAEPKPGALVVAWQRDEKGDVLFDEAGQPKPYIVRHGVGAGCVTWVAQDLGDPQILGRNFTPFGWSYVWDTVMDWPNDPVLANDNRVNGKEETAPYKANITWELGKSFINRMDLPSTSAALIGIAVLFFIVYWVAAGPGSYFVLLKKNQATLSWFTFAAMAIAATGLTVVIVKLVLRGDPQLRHMTFVRYVPNEPARAHAQFGLYIPRDGQQKIELKDAAANRASYVTGFNLHPAFNQSDIDFPARQEYQIPVKELREKDRSADPKSISVPYRSTLKKFQAEWIGDLKAGIDGTVTLHPDIPILRGTLTNNTGKDLRTVYLAVRHHGVELNETTVEQEHVLYIAHWKAGDVIDFAKEYRLPSAGGAPYVRLDKSRNNPDSVLFTPLAGGAPPRFRGQIKRDDRQQAIDAPPDNWTDVWYHPWRATGFSDREYTEEDPLTPRALPVLSFFNRLPVPRNPVRGNTPDRFDILRRSLRHLDCSNVISGGNMAVVAVSSGKEEPLPIPLEVEGDRVTGQGVVYHQFVVPVDRKAITKPPTKSPATTQPATQPTKGKAEA